MERALKSAGKQIDKSEKKQIKAHVNELNKVLSKTKVDTITDSDLSTLRDAISRLEISSTNVCSIAGEPEDDEQI